MKKIRNICSDGCFLSELCPVVWMMTIIITTSRLMTYKVVISILRISNSGYNLIEGDELVLAPTFKFTIDSITPDVSYEWYIDKQLQTGESGATYTFKADKSGTYQSDILQ